MTPIAAAHGNHEALGALIRAYHDRVYRYGVRVCRDAFDADDAVREAFTKLERRSGVQKDKGALSWLMTVVRRTCMQLLQPFARERKHLGERGEVEDAVSSTSDPEDALHRWELVQRGYGAVASLERPYREVLVLRDLEGLSGDETCAALGLPLAAMKTRLHRARAQLRELLQPLAVS